MERMVEVTVSRGYHLGRMFSDRGPERESLPDGGFLDLTSFYRCPGCGRERRVVTIKGRVSEKPCSEKCLAAVGPNCECACGGANHGAGHGRA